MGDIHDRFRSEDWRLRRVEAVQTRNVEFFSQFDMQSGSLLLEVQFKLPVLPGIKVDVLYRRAETSTVVYKLTHPGTNTSIIWKVFAVPKKTVSKTDERHAWNYEIEMRYLKICAELVRLSVCPHIVLPIAFSLVSREELKHMRPPEEKQEETLFANIFAECCDMTLTELLTKLPLDLYQVGALLLQVVLTLRILQSVVRGFRHNDLHPSNVLIQQLGSFPPRSLVKYEVLGENFFLDVHRCPYRICLWDMAFGSMNPEDSSSFPPLLVPVKREIFKLKDVRNSRTCHNAYYDLHKFFDSTEYILGHKHVKTRSSPELQALLDFVVPESLKSRSKGLSHLEEGGLRIWEQEHTTPVAVLQHNFFDAFRTCPLLQSQFVRVYHYPRKT